MMNYDQNALKQIIAREQAAGFPLHAKMKRLTIDVPERLHSAIKMECARRGVKMAEAIRAILASEFTKGE